MKIQCIQGKVSVCESSCEVPIYHEAKNTLQYSSEWPVITFTQYISTINEGAFDLAAVHKLSLESAVFTVKAITNGENSVRYRKVMVLDKESEIKYTNGIVYHLWQEKCATTESKKMYWLFFSQKLQGIAFLQFPTALHFTLINAVMSHAEIQSLSNYYSELYSGCGCNWWRREGLESIVLRVVFTFIAFVLVSSFLQHWVFAQSESAQILHFWFIRY